MQPLGGWLHPCRTVSGGDLRHRQVLEGREDKPKRRGLKAYGGRRRMPLTFYGAGVGLPYLDQPAAILGEV